MKNEKPNINLVLKLFRLQNCSKPRPAEAVISMKIFAINMVIIIMVDKNKKNERSYTHTSRQTRRNIMPRKLAVVLKQEQHRTFLFVKNEKKKKWNEKL